MTVRERSIQQLYPIGAMSGRPLALIAAVFAPLYAVVMVFHNGADVNSPLLAVASIVFVLAASFTVVVGTSPLRAPFSGQSAAFTLLWANASMLLGVASTWQTNTFVRDDWGPAIVGIMIIAIAAYRPPRELVIGGVLSSILAGFLVLLELNSLSTRVPPAVHMVMMITPILLLTIGAARFTQVVVRAIERWSRRARVAVSSVDDEDESWIARSVQQDRVTILNRDVLPFFAELLAHDEVTEEDARRARRISDAIRSIMVVEADRSWLHMVIDQASAAPGPERFAGDMVVDPQHLAPRMNLDQRSSVRAFIAALFAHPSFSSEDFGVTLMPNGDYVTVTIHARLDVTPTHLRSEFAPFFAVMRILFSNLGYEFVQPVLTLKFSYDE